MHLLNNSFTFLIPTFVLDYTNGNNVRIKRVYHKSRNLNAAVVLVPGCWCFATRAVWTSVGAAHLLQTAEGGLLEATCRRHCSFAELTTVRMEAIGVNGASSRCWPWPWPYGPIRAVPPVHGCGPRAEGVALLLGEADVPALFSLWCNQHHNGWINIQITLSTNCWQTHQGLVRWVNQEAVILIGNSLRLLLENFLSQSK